MEIYLKVIIVVFMSSTYVASWRPYKVSITEMNYKYNDDVSNVNVSLTEAGDNTPLLNILFVPKRKLFSIYATIKVTMHPEGERNTTIVNFNKTINYCKFLANPNLEPILRKYYEIVERFGSIPKRCPIKANDVIFIYNLYADEEELPHTWQQGKLHFFVEFFTEARNNPNILLFNVDVWADIDFGKALSAFQAFGNM